ncbi:MAG: PucR family transcriptional regulator ligand-binding domain-containing protein [Sporolactobacillus sp.]
MNIADLVQIPLFHDFHIVAGKEGIEREICSVNMMDAPDIIDYLKANDLLITTGYHLQNHPELFCQLVEEMAVRNCAALGIKSHRFLGGIPNNIIELADRLKFPIIDLPNDLALVDIANQTLTQILDARTKELQFAIDTHQQFTDHIVNGEGVDRLLIRLSEMIGFRTVLLDSYLRQMAPRHHATNQMKNVLDRNVLEPILIGEDNNESFFSVIQSKKTYSLYVLYTYRKRKYFLLIGGFIPPANRLLTLTVEQASNVLVFELMKQEALIQTEKKMRDSFFANLLQGSFSSSNEIISRAKEFGLVNGLSYLLIAGELDMRDASLSFVQFQLENNEVFDYIEGNLESLPFPGHFFVNDHACVMVCEVTMSLQSSLRFLMPAMKALQQRVYHIFNYTISFGISRLFTDLSELADANQEASAILQNGKQAGEHAFIHVYQANELNDLLRQMPMDDLRKIYQETLQELAFPIKEEERVLLNTLFVYVESNCQISETAKKLFVHRNTVIYRIEKCEQILGLDFKDSDVSFRLRFAFRIRPLFEN